jgi:hypothetical protein
MQCPGTGHPKYKIISDLLEKLQVMIFMYSLERFNLCTFWQQICILTQDLCKLLLIHLLSCSQIVSNDAPFFSIVKSNLRILSLDERPLCKLTCKFISSYHSCYLLYLPPASTLKSCAFYQQIIFVFHMTLRINSNYFPEQHWLISLCNGVAECFLWD